METILRYVIIAAVGALASILANQSIAVFNDGLRPVLPEYLEKRMDVRLWQPPALPSALVWLSATAAHVHCRKHHPDSLHPAHHRHHRHLVPGHQKGHDASGVIGAVYGVACCSACR